MLFRILGRRKLVFPSNLSQIKKMYLIISLHFIPRMSDDGNTGNFKFPNWDCSIAITKFVMNKKIAVISCMCSRIFNLRWKSRTTHSMWDADSPFFVAWLRILIDWPVVSTYTDLHRNNTNRINVLKKYARYSLIQAGFGTVRVCMGKGFDMKKLEIGKST